MQCNAMQYGRGWWMCTAHCKWHNAHPFPCQRFNIKTIHSNAGNNSKNNMQNENVYRPVQIERWNKITLICKWDPYTWNATNEATHKKRETITRMKCSFFFFRHSSQDVFLLYISCTMSGTYQKSEWDISSHSIFLFQNKTKQKTNWQNRISHCAYRNMIGWVHSWQNGGRSAEQCCFSIDETAAVQLQVAENSRFLVMNWYKWFDSYCLVGRKAPL